MSLLSQYGHQVTNEVYLTSSFQTCLMVISQVPECITRLANSPAATIFTVTMGKSKWRSLDFYASFFRWWCVPLVWPVCDAVSQTTKTHGSRKQGMELAWHHPHYPRDPPSVPSCPSLCLADLQALVPQRRMFPPGPTEFHWPRTSDHYLHLGLFMLCNQQRWRWSSSLMAKGEIG